MTPFHQQASELIQRGQVAEALALLKQHPKDLQCLVRLREYHVGERQLDQAMPVLQRLTDEHGAEAHVSRSIHALLGGDVQAALRECEAALRIDPESATAHNHLGRAQHNLGRSAQAVQSLEAALRIDPAYAEAWQNLGHVLRASSQLNEAVEAYQQALAIAPAYTAARLNLGITLSLLDQPEPALAAFEQILESDPEHVEAMVNAGLALHVLGQLDRARGHFERAIRLDPRNADAHCYLGVLLNELLDSDGASAALEAALRLNPRDIEARAELAAVFEQSNRLEAARREVEAGLQTDPSHPALKLEAAKLDRRDGNIESALGILRGIGPQQLQPRLAQQYYFELGQALDRAGESGEAFRAFTAGNALAARSPRRAGIDPQAFFQRCDDMSRWLSQGAPGLLPEAGERSGDTGRDLCFLLGFPRSGTTLLDTFLSAHPAVQSIEEKPTLERVVATLYQSQKGYPAGLEALTVADLEALRGEYRVELARLGLIGEGTTVVLDKLPMRTLNAGLIQRLFPDARLLFALRHPCDVVLSNFMQAYAENEAFIHFDTLGDSARMYDRVMALWGQYDAVLELKRTRCRYEDLVMDTELELERICGFLGIDLNQAMLDLQSRLAARGRIRTNSYQQVAEPIYQRSSGRWKHYAAQMKEVLPVLAPYAEQFGYEL
jgi:tetratricopeptide (TPR) repeat protein